MLATLQLGKGHAYPYTVSVLASEAAIFDVKCDRAYGAHSRIWSTLRRGALVIVARLMRGVRGTAGNRPPRVRSARQRSSGPYRTHSTVNIRGSARILAPLTDSDVSRIASFGDVEVPSWRRIWKIRISDTRGQAPRLHWGTRVIHILERAPLSAQSQIVREISLDWVGSDSGASGHPAKRQ